MRIPQGLTRFLIFALFAALSCLLLPGISIQGVRADLAGEIKRIHDPSRIIACEGKYYVFYTGNKLPVRSSTDMVQWTSGPPVLEKVPDWIHEAVPAAKGDFVWAPDIILVKDQYWLFYSYSTFGSQTSAIGLVSNPTLNPDNPAYKWTDRGLVIASTPQVGYNAIDPAPVWDKAGNLWMTFGSWHREGIQVVQLNVESGKPIGTPVTIAKGQAQGPEAPYLHWRDGYYYQFENEGECCKAMNSTYRVMVGRSKTITGPYLDKTGKDLNSNGGSVFLETKGAEIGPGHIGIFEESGIEHVTFHFYDGRANGTPTLARRTLVWGADGWPVALSELVAGQFSIHSRPSSLALSIHNRDLGNGAAINRSAFNGDTAQKWNVISLNDGYYSLASMANGKYLTLADGGTRIELQPWLNNDSQHWRIEPSVTGFFRVASKINKKVLTFPNAQGGLLQCENWNGADSQHWDFRPLP